MVITINIQNGLTDREVLESRRKYGENLLTNKKRNTFFNLLIESLNDPIIKILLIALAIKVLFLFKESNIFETVGIVIAIFLASFISTISEYGSEKAFARLQEEASKIKCRVKRNLKKIEINIDEIVVGDIVFLSSGDKVPADGVIIKGNISVDESSLTGESKEKNKDIKSFLYMGSVAASGDCIMKVISVGDNTHYGKIASAVQDFAPESPLKLKLRALAGIISKVGYISSFLVSVSYLFNVIVIENNFDLIKISNFITNAGLLLSHIFYALTLAVTIIVVAVPEGLPMMITLVLSSNMKRMLKNNVLVRKLVGIETAGCLNILFTDKTGTLTEGKLKAIGLTTVDDNYYTSIKEIKNSELKELISLSLFYNNESEFEDENIIGGNTTDKAILEFVGNINYKYIIKDKIPFDSKKKYSAITLDYKKEMTFVKGAYEILIDKCKCYYDKNGNTKELLNKEKIINSLKSSAESGVRILAICVSLTKDIEDLYLIGFIYLKDNIRQYVYKAIDLVRSANIKTIMITGDAKETAIGIAKELNMLDSESVVLTSEELNKLSDKEVKEILSRLKIVARSLPEDKNRLVKLSQELGLVVGMTGDGVNDAPALKKADVGFAMGSGSEVAKEVSDIIILDDNFLSISSAILFGRTVFKSIRKFIIFQLTINFCAVLLSIVGPYFGILSPITVIQMLWVNMVMDTLAALAFSYEAPIVEYMKELPKPKEESIMNGYMINQIIWDGIYSSVLCILFLKLPLINNLFRVGSNDKYLMTAFFGLFIFLSIFNLFNVRTHRINIFANILKNKIFLLVISLIAIVQIILIYFGGEIFRTTGLTFFEFQIMILISFSVIPVDIIRKLILRSKNKKNGV